MLNITNLIFVNKTQEKREEQQLLLLKKAQDFTSAKLGKLNEKRFQTCFSTTKIENQVRRKPSSDHAFQADPKPKPERRHNYHNNSDSVSFYSPYKNIQQIEKESQGSKNAEKLICIGSCSKVLYSKGNSPASVNTIHSGRAAQKNERKKDYCKSQDFSPQTISTLIATQFDVNFKRPHFIVKNSTIDYHNSEERVLIDGKVVSRTPNKSSSFLDGGKNLVHTSSYPKNVNFNQKEALSHKEYKRISPAVRIKNHEEIIKNYQTKFDRINGNNSKNYLHIMPEVKVQEMVKGNINHNRKARISSVFERRKKSKDVSQDYLIVSKKKLSNSPNSHLIAKQEKIYQMRREAAQANAQALQSVALAQHDLMLCSQQVVDENRFTKIDVEWLKNNPSQRKYYLNILNKPSYITGIMVVNVPNRCKSGCICRRTSKKIILNGKNIEEQKIREGLDMMLHTKSKRKDERISTSNTCSKIAFSNIYSKNKYKYIVTPGNNSNLIREAMQQRNWWVEIPNVDSAFNFKWQPVSFRMKFRKLSQKNPITQVVNHFENHRCLTEKSSMFNNLQNHCEFIKKNIFEIAPIQFCC
ncbi:unnamed protein product [Moneuplotes crassus]|uniref:Uncharacterized protein n=1 Tax=Euplotes crassus TaxID=5936 RepID=A0AAD1XJD7_EUPCR|nr:unnamed protein product [Moneuplotes crassus]